MEIILSCKPWNSILLWRTKKARSRSEGRRDTLGSYSRNQPVLTALGTLLISEENSQPPITQVSQPKTSTNKQVYITNATAIRARPHQSLTSRRPAAGITTSAPLPTHRRRAPRIKHGTTTQDTNPPRRPSARVHRVRTAGWPRPRLHPRHPRLRRPEPRHGRGLSPQGPPARDDLARRLRGLEPEAREGGCGCGRGCPVSARPPGDRQVCRRRMERRRWVLYLIPSYPFACMLWILQREAYL